MYTDPLHVLDRGSHDVSKGELRHPDVTHDGDVIVHVIHGGDELTVQTEGQPGELLPRRELMHAGKDPKRKSLVLTQREADDRGRLRLWLYHREEDL